MAQTCSASCSHFFCAFNPSVRPKWSVLLSFCIPVPLFAPGQRDFSFTLRVHDLKNGLPVWNCAEHFPHQLPPCSSPEAQIWEKTSLMHTHTHTPTSQHIVWLRPLIDAEISNVGFSVLVTASTRGSGFNDCTWPTDTLWPDGLNSANVTLEIFRLQKLSAYSDSSNFFCQLLCLGIMVWFHATALSSPLCCPASGCDLSHLYVHSPVILDFPFFFFYLLTRHYQVFSLLSPSINWNAETT